MEEDFGMVATRKSGVGAVVLAAGRSSRMGEPKQLLVLDGKPLLQHTLNNVHCADVGDVVLVLGAAAEDIRPQVSSKGVKIVVNQDYQRGMGSSLGVGLSALDPQTDAALIVLADQPFVQSATLDQIIEAYRRSGAEIVIPMYQGFRGNPVLLDRSVFPELMALTGDIGCRSIFGDHVEGIMKVAVDDIGVLLDIDSKEDFAKAQRFAQAGATREMFIDHADLQGREIPEAAKSPGDLQELVIVGTEPVAISLARLGRVLRFRVTFVDPLLRAGDVDADMVLNALDFSQLAPAAGRYVVIVNRGKFDEEAVAQAFHANSNYVGIMANRKRAQELRQRVEAMGLPADKLATLHAPAGLAIHAETPEEIALSIMAEIVATKRNRGEKT